MPQIPSININVEDISKQRNKVCRPESPKEVLQDVLGDESKNIQGAVDEICQKYLQDIKQSDLNIKRDINIIHLPVEPGFCIKVTPGKAISRDDMIECFEHQQDPNRKKSYNKKVIMKRKRGRPSKKLVSVEEDKNILKNQVEENTKRKQNIKMDISDKKRQISKRGRRLNIPPGRSVTAEEVEVILKNQEAEKNKKKENLKKGAAAKKSQLPTPELDISLNIPREKSLKKGDVETILNTQEEKPNKRDKTKKDDVPDRQCQLPVIRTLRLHLPPGLSVSADEVEMILKNKEDEINKKK